MVNVFIIHSSKDYGVIKEKVEPYLKGEDEQSTKECNANVLILESKKKVWRGEAKKKIKKAQVVVIVIGKDANDETKYKTMGWETKQALKYNKQIMIYNPGKEKMPSYLISKNKFTSMEEPVASEKTLELIKKRIDDYSNGYYDIFSNKYDQLPEERKENYYDDYIEQYKMFQKSSEDLVNRRQSVNSFYITVNSAISTLTGIFIGLLNMPAKLYVIMLMSLIGIFLVLSWLRLLDSYGKLNSAKIKVLTLIEKNLPVSLYDVEWQIMSDKLNNKKYVSFTSSEKRIPLFFLIIYSIALVASIVLLIINYFQ